MLKVPRIKDEAYVLPTIWRCYLSGPVCLLPWVHRSMEILPALLIPNSWDSLSERFCKQSSHIPLRIVCSFQAKNRIYQGLTENSPSTALALRLFRVLNHVSLNIPPGAQASSSVKIACWLSTQETQLEVVTPKNRSNPAAWQGHAISVVIYLEVAHFLVAIPWDQLCRPRLLGILHLITWETLMAIGSPSVPWFPGCPMAWQWWDDG